MPTRSAAAKTQSCEYTVIPAAHGAWGNPLGRASRLDLIGAPERPRSRLMGVTEYWIGLTASLWFDASELHHLAPFLGFVGNELAKIGGRARQRDAAQVVKPRL
jgi:hypothetical protein